MRSIARISRTAQAARSAVGVSQRCLTAPRVTDKPPARYIHASSSASRKKHQAQPIEEDEYDNEGEGEIDLFESSSSGSSSADRAARRSALVSEITSLKAVEPASRRSTIAAMRIGILRKIISLSDTPDELEELRDVLQTWRWAGKRVTQQTAKELIGRCCNLGRPDLALEFSEDRMQYGLPDLPLTSLSKLHHALLSESQSKIPSLDSSRTISPTLAVLRLALLSRQNNAATNEAEALLARVKIEAKDSFGAPEWRAEGLKMVEAAGGAWAEAGRKLQVQL